MDSGRIEIFCPHLDLSHGEGKVLTVEKDIYNRNLILFVQHVRELVVYKGVDLVKANLTILFCNAFFKWYTLELDESDRDNQMKTPGIKKWIKKFTMRFKISTGVAFGLFVDEKYTFSDVFS